MNHSCSQYFLFWHYNISGTFTVLLCEVSETAVVSLLDYLYTGQLELSGDLTELLQMGRAAELLALSEVPHPLLY